MPQNVKIKLNGAQVKAKSRAAGIKGLRLGMEHLLQVAREIVPIEEKILQDSGVASVDEPGLKAAVSFDTPYAVRQHEELTWKHDPGRTAKYLEGPMVTEKDTILELVAAQIRRALR